MTLEEIENKVETIRTRMPDTDKASDLIELITGIIDYLRTVEVSK